MSFNMTEKVNRGNLAAAACVFAWAVLGTVAGAQQTGAEQDEGRALFIAYGCYQCHGYEGQGGSALRIAPTVYPFEAFAAFVRKPPSEMPAYPGNLLSDDDLMLIYSYARSVPAPPNVEDLPALSQN